MKAPIHYTLLIFLLFPLASQAITTPHDMTTFYVSSEVDNTNSFNNNNSAQQNVSTYFILDTSHADLSNSKTISVFEKQSSVPQSSPTQQLNYDSAAKMQYELGLSYLNQPNSNNDLAARWIRLSAQQGYLPAQYDLAMMYLNGIGVKTQPAKAAGWLHQASKQGYAKAQSDLAWLFEKGIGVRQSNYLAQLWYQEAANKGDASAQYHLAELYEKEDKFNSNQQRAVTQYHAAAQQGHGLAQKRLGDLYASGQGVTQDTQSAYNWYKTASQNGVPQAKRLAQELRLQMGNAPSKPSNLVTQYQYKTFEVSKGLSLLLGTNAS